MSYEAHPTPVSNQRVTYPDQVIPKREDAILGKDRELAWLYCDDVWNWPACTAWRLKERIANLHDDFGDAGFDPEPDEHCDWDQYAFDILDSEVDELIEALELDNEEIHTQPRYSDYVRSLECLRRGDPEIIKEIVKKMKSKSECESEEESIKDLEDLPDQDDERRRLGYDHPGMHAFLFGDNEDIVLELKKLPKIENPGHMDTEI